MEHTIASLIEAAPSTNDLHPAPEQGQEAEVMYPALTRFLIQQLRRGGISQVDVAKQVGVHVRTVRRIEREPEISSEAVMQPRKDQKGPGRPSKTGEFRDFVTSTLMETPKLQTLELLRLARQKGYTGAKTAFFDMVREIRQRKTNFVTRFEGLAGEFSQHDFGQVNISFLNGDQRRVRFFASRLKWSRYAAVDLVPDETAETLVRTLLDHFYVLGGIPQKAVFDRPKTVAIEWKKDGTITKWNDIFGQAIVEIGFRPEVCFPYSPNQKGSVENIVGWVKSSFFKQRRFHDMDDLRAQLREWLDETNRERKSRATGIIPAVRREEELRRLTPPKVTPEGFAFRKPITVGPTGRFNFEGRELSMGPNLCGQAGTIFVHRDKLRAVIGKHEATFPRWTPHKRVTLPAHRDAELARLSKRGRQYCTRQHLLDLGPAAERFLTELCTENRDWTAPMLELHGLLQCVGDDAMRKALRAAADVGVYDVVYVARLLGKADEVETRAASESKRRRPVERSGAQGNLSPERNDNPARAQTLGTGQGCPQGTAGGGLALTRLEGLRDGRHLRIKTEGRQRL